MIKVIFFDWGHTFTGSGFTDAREPINKLLKPYGLDWDVFFPYWRSLYQLRSSRWIKTDEEFHVWLGRILQKRDLPLEQIQKVIVDSHRIPKENIELIKKIKEDYKVGLLTNNVQEWVERVLRNYKIEDLFDVVIVSSRVGVRKPEGRIFYEALKSLSAKPEEAVFVSDEVSEDLVGAKACGMRIIWLDTGIENEWKQQERELAEFLKPDAIIKNLIEVPPIIKKWER
ncbi:MAG: HAD family hydrolase [Candidatus Pacebacteria bacterium]|nr:HAD family hydrolase [Candidatus Paceibacterota bacterium]